MLGLETRKWVGEGSLYWRFAEHWRVDLNYFSINRNGTRALSTQVEWGGNTYPVGANQPFTHFAFGFGVHSLTLRLDVDNPNSKMQTRIVFQGPAAYASYSF